jgi:hypothetical protein
VIFGGLSVLAKDQPFQVVSWPDSGQSVLRFTFSKFKELGGGMGKERTYITDVAADNLSDRTITGASFSLYLFDKSKARIGEGYINLTNVTAGETVKFQITIAASGSPSSVAVTTSAPRAVSMTVNSVPQGAALSVVGIPVKANANSGGKPNGIPLEGEQQSERSDAGTLIVR